jgi:hypothetical protein
MRGGGLLDLRAGPLYVTAAGRSDHGACEMAIEEENSSYSRRELTI